MSAINPIRNDMMSKRVFSNISNLRNEDNELKDKKTVKRALKLSPNKAIKKKSKCDKQVVLKNNENEVIRRSKSDVKSDPTLTIERKVKAIDISSKCEAVSPIRHHLSLRANTSLKSQVSELSDDSFEADAIDFKDPTTYYCPPTDLPEGLEDFDKSQLGIIESEPHYAFEIFKYYKQRETKVPTKKYLQNQPELNKGMRAVLVDWMVEVQESFE